MGERNENIDPTINVQFDNGNVLLPRSRAKLFTFLGRTAMSHIFISSEVQPNEEVNTGSYLWRDTIGEEAFDKVCLMMIRMGFRAALNEPEIPECDQNAYDKMHPADSVPDLGIADEVESELALASETITDEALQRWLDERK